jgi:hypothetical protein
VTRRFALTALHCVRDDRTATVMSRVLWHSATTLPDVRFERQRKHIRNALERDGVADDIDAIVKALLNIPAS